MSFPDPQIEGISRSANSSEFPLCCNFLLQKIQGSVLNRGLNQRPCKYTRVLHLKMVGFVPGVIIQIVWILRKMLTLLIHSESKLFFLSKYWFVFFPSGIENFTLAEEGLIRKPFFFIVISNFWPSRYSKKANNSDLSRVSNCNFSETTVAISSYDFFKGIRKYQKVHLVGFQPVADCMYPHIYRDDFHHTCLNGNSYSLIWAFHEKIIAFDPCIKTLKS